jgi:hypothetical protein
MPVVGVRYAFQAFSDGSHLLFVHGRNPQWR